MGKEVMMVHIGEDPFIPLDPISYKLTMIISWLDGCSVRTSCRYRILCFQGHHRISSWPLLIYYIFNEVFSLKVLNHLVLILFSLYSYCYNLICILFITIGKLLNKLNFY